MTKLDAEGAAMVARLLTGLYATKSESQPEWPHYIDIISAGCAAQEPGDKAGSGGYGNGGAAAADRARGAAADARVGRRPRRRAPAEHHAPGRSRGRSALAAALGAPKSVSEMHMQVVQSGGAQSPYGTHAA